PTRRSSDLDQDAHVDSVVRRADAALGTLQVLLVVLTTAAPLGHRLATGDRTIAAGGTGALADQLAVLGGLGQDGVDHFLIIEDEDLLIFAQLVHGFHALERARHAIERLHHLGTIGAAEFDVRLAVI